MKVPNQNFVPPKTGPLDPKTGMHMPEGTGFTTGVPHRGLPGAMEFQIPSQPTNTILRFRYHQSGRTSKWIEGNPFAQ
jgi:hypothetical protein